MGDNVFELLKRNHFTLREWGTAWQTHVIGCAAITPRELATNSTLEQAEDLIRAKLIAMFESTKNKCEEELVRLKGGAEL